MSGAAVAAVLLVHAVLPPVLPPAPPPPEPDLTPDPPLTIVQVPRSPNHGGTRPLTDTIIMHSTRSGRRDFTLDEEFASTASWFANPAAQVSAHAIIDGEGRVGFPVPTDLIAWHDAYLNERTGVYLTSNGNALGIEVCQPTIDRPYTDAQYRAAATLVRQWSLDYSIPRNRKHIVAHSETPSGIAQGKSDPGPQWDWDRFMALVLGADTVAPEPLTPDAVLSAILHTADQAKVPRLALLALAIAESGLNPYARRPRDPGADAAYWTDVSHGLYQQTVRWSVEYREWCAANGHAPADFPGSDVCEQIGSLYYNPEHAGAVAVAQLRAKLEQTGGDILGALSRYNKPNMEPSENPNLPNYERGMAAATALLDRLP